MYCEATLDSFETETITNHRECSDDYQTCSGPMMTTTETVRRGLVTDEEFAKYQLGKTRTQSN